MCLCEYTARVCFVFVHSESFNVFVVISQLVCVSACVCAVMVLIPPVMHHNAYMHA